jgi:hypothetical protein
MIRLYSLNFQDPVITIEAETQVDAAQQSTENDLQLDISHFLDVPKIVSKKKRKTKSQVISADFVITSQAYQKMQQDKINSKNLELQLKKEKKEQRELKKKQIELNSEILRQQKKEKRELKKTQKALQVLERKEAREKIKIEKALKNTIKIEQF